MLYQAIYTPPGEPPPPRAILTDPEISRYAAGWGAPGDLGFAACAPAVSANESPVGAAWLRLFAPDAPGYGFVSAGIPELSLAVLPDWRSQGIGSRLLDHLLSAAALQFPAVSLCVTAANPALRLYERNGFTTIRKEGASLVMLRRFTMDANS